MCGRFEALTAEQVAEVIAEVEGKERARAEHWPAQGIDVRPTTTANIITASRHELACTPLRWGFDAPQGSGLVFNSRIERVLSGEGMWGSMAEQGRCIVPAVAFFEPHRSETLISARTGKSIKAQYRFAASGGAPLLMAGLAANGRFSVVTTEPSPEVGAVHDRSPLLLTPQAAWEWMQGDWTQAAHSAAIGLAAQREQSDALEQPSLF